MRRQTKGFLEQNRNSKAPSIKARNEEETAKGGPLLLHTSYAYLIYILIIHMNSIWSSTDASLTGKAYVTLPQQDPSRSPPPRRR